MGMLKIKLVDASGAPMAGQSVKVSGIDALQTSAQGMTQFLITDTAQFDIAIGGTSVWSGNSAELARDEVFKADGTGFARVGPG